MWCDEGDLSSQMGLNLLALSSVFPGLPPFPREECRRSGLSETQSQVPGESLLVKSQLHLVSESAGALPF